MPKWWQARKENKQQDKKWNSVQDKLAHMFGILLQCCALSDLLLLKIASLNPVQTNQTAD